MHIVARCAGNAFCGMLRLGPVNILLMVPFGELVSIDVYIQQSDLFWGMDRGFVKTIMDVAVKESREEGDFLFLKGDNAKGVISLVEDTSSPSICSGDM